MARYKIVRSYFKGRRVVVKKNLTLAEAQAHCKDPETSSKTATSRTAKERTRLHGPWFDLYTEQ